jgi:hypothetical protein
MTYEVDHEFVMLLAYIDALEGLGPWAGVAYDNIPKPDFTNARKLRKEILDAEAKRVPD